MTRSETRAGMALDGTDGFADVAGLRGSIVVTLATPVAHVAAVESGASQFGLVRRTTHPLTVTVGDPRLAAWIVDALSLLAGPSVKEKGR